MLSQREPHDTAVNFDIYWKQRHSTNPSTRSWGTPQTTTDWASGVPGDWHDGVNDRVICDTGVASNVSTMQLVLGKSTGKTASTHPTYTFKNIHNNLFSATYQDNNSQTYISDFSYYKNWWNGAVLKLIYGTTLTIYYLLLACDWLQNEWPWVAISRKTRFSH